MENISILKKKGTDRTISLLVKYLRINIIHATIIMELAENGSLSKVLKKIQQSVCPEKYDDTSRQIILFGISRGMKYLHDRNIIHRDLKSDNILISNFRF